jgi:hypothetical protein
MIIAKYKVNIVESERSWGQKIDEVRYFDSKEGAEAFIKEYNKENTKPVVPDIYWRASLVGVVDMDYEPRGSKRLI